jgi:chemotaxis signal transduction protein
MTQDTPSPSPASEKISHCWFKQGPTRFALRVADLAGVVSLPVLRPLPLSDQSLVGFGLFEGQVLPVFDPLSLAGLSLVDVGHPVTVAVTRVLGRPMLAFALTEVGSIIDVQETSLSPAGGRVAAAFRGEQPLGDDSLLVLDPLGLAQSMGLAPATTST